MRLATRVLRGLSIMAPLTLVPAVARAEDPATVYTRAWTTCSAGALRSCNSVTLQTQGTFSGSTRVGTSVVLTVRNLQGTNPVDNMAWSALRTIRLYRNTTLGSTSGSATGALSGGATGTASPFAWATLTSNTTWGLLRFVGASGNRIGGCATATGAAMYACPGEVTFSISSSEIFNADQFSELLFIADGPSGDVICTTDQTRDGTFAACDARNTTMTTTVTPEPMTVALLGTGLLGVGAAGWRRRRKNNEV